MENLIIDKTNETPYVELNVQKGIFTIEGRSLPENAITFYTPILSWLKSYIENPNETTVFEIYFEYFNSASSKQILNMLIILKELHLKNQSLKICWYYQEDDELIEEEGIEFQEILDIPFEFMVK